LLLALPHIFQRKQKVSIRTCLGGDEIAVPISFLESPDGGHKFVQVPAMESAVEQGPTESQFIQSADRILVELALLPPLPNAVHPVRKLLVQWVAPRHIAVAMLFLERL
jgi:hypothetical protein